jgi:uncharacterized protein YhaN
MQFLTREQVELMSVDQCQECLDLLAQTWDLDQPLEQNWDRVWPNLDQIVDTMLYLEDRLKTLEMSQNLSKALTIRWADKKMA